jgi:hypothetical protein
MPYQSPLHILESLKIRPDELTDEGINRLRKKLLSEFNLNPTVTIDINGKAYTKDAILKTIDRLKEVDNLTGHQFIFERKNLLTWLENPLKWKLPNQEINEVFSKYKNDDFHYKILGNAFNEYIAYYIKNRHFRKVEESLQLVPSLGEEHSYEVYDTIYTEIQSINDDLEEAQKSPNIRRDKPKFGFTTEPEWTDFLNILPDTFESVRDSFCYCACNYTVAIQTKDRKWAYEISSQLVQTTCDAVLKNSISKNHGIFTENYFAAEGNASSSSDSGWGGLRIAFFIIVIIIRIVSCSGH